MPQNFDPNSPPLNEGVPITLAGQHYILPPCSLATLKRHAKGIDAFAKMGGNFTLNEVAINTIESVLYEALRRNYPDITADFVAENLGLDMIMETFQAAMDASGLMRKTKPDSAATAGEGGTLGESNGTASSPTS